MLSTLSLSLSLSLFPFLTASATPMLVSLLFFFLHLAQFCVALQCKGTSPVTTVRAELSWFHVIRTLIFGHRFGFLLTVRLICVALGCREVLAHYVTFSSGHNNQLLLVKIESLYDESKLCPVKMKSGCKNRTGLLPTHKTFTRQPITSCVWYCRYAPSPQLRGHEEAARDWLRSHSQGGLQDSTSNSPFSPGSSLTSPSGTRFNFAQLCTTHGINTFTSHCTCVCV